MARAVLGRAAAPRQGDFCPLPHGAGGGGRLDSAVTERDARPHLMESHKGIQSPAFNSRRMNTGRVVKQGANVDKGKGKRCHVYSQC